MSEEAARAKQLSKSDRIAAWFLPNIGDFIFLLVLAVIVWLKPSFIFGDGSTGWHIATGNYILEHGIPFTDIHSYTFPNKPWVAYEWLSDVLMALLVRMNNGDLNLLAAVVTCAIAALMLTLYERCRKEGADFPLALFIVILGAIMSTVHWLARPHIFTFFGVYFFTTWLEDWWQGRLSARQLLIRLPLFTIIWVNTHPAFLFAFALTGVYFVSAAVLSFCKRGTEAAVGYIQKLKTASIALFLCLLATAINPYGVKLHAYMVDYVKGTPGLAEVTHEFMSPVFHGGLQSVCLELLFAILIIGLAFTRNSLSMPRLITCIAFAHLTLSAVRNMPLFAIVALPAISQLYSRLSFFDALDSESAQKPWWAPFAFKWREISEGFRENELLCNRHVLSIGTFLLLAIAALNNGSLLGFDLIKSGWSKDDKPTATLDYLMEAENRGVLDPQRGFNYDNWGGYIRYRTGNKVVIDDRAEFFGEHFYYKYNTVNLALPGWREQLNGEMLKGTAKDGASIQWVLVPKSSRLAAALRNEPAWGRPVKEDAASYLFIRK